MYIAGKLLTIFKTLIRTKRHSVEPPISNHPKSQALLQVAYRR